MLEEVAEAIELGPAALLAAIVTCCILCLGSTVKVRWVTGCRCFGAGSFLPTKKN